MAQGKSAQTAERTEGARCEWAQRKAQSAHGTSRQTKEIREGAFGESGQTEQRTAGATAVEQTRHT